MGDRTPSAASLRRRPHSQLLGTIGPPCFPRSAPAESRKINRRRRARFAQLNNARNGSMQSQSKAYFSEKCAPMAMNTQPVAYRATHSTLPKAL